jgi:2-polyprenyl-6-methoxyphenol hydroxylase-like FAD-dependent oxidoreductase
MNPKSVLVSGAGIAGPTLAFWLKAAGLQPTLVERAPTFRSSGYVIDFWGLGYEIAERMGLVSEINRIGYHMRELRIVDSRGERVTGFGTSVFHELTGGRFVLLVAATSHGSYLKRLRERRMYFLATRLSVLRKMQMAFESNSNMPTSGSST